jgi:hypothetical protein
VTRLAWLALLLALGAGCTITAEQSGAPALLGDFSPPANGAAADAIVKRLGVPDEIDATEQGYRFVYRFARRDERRFLIAYGIKLVTDQRTEHREGALDLWFDADGTLLASRLRDGERDGAE